MDMSGNTYYIDIWKDFGQVKFSFEDIWQRVNFDAQCVSEQTGKLSGGSRVYDPRFRQICRASTSTVHWKYVTDFLYIRNDAKYEYILQIYFYVFSENFNLAVASIKPWIIYFHNR